MSKSQIGILKSNVTVQAVALHIGDVRNWTVPDGVLPAISPEIAGARQAFRIALPRLVNGLHFPNNVIAGVRESAGVGDTGVVVRRDHPPAQVVVVADGGVRWRVVIGRKAALALQATQKRHADIVRAADISVVSVLLQHDNYVRNLRDLSERSCCHEEEYQGQSKDNY